MRLFSCGAALVAIAICTVPATAEAQEAAARGTFISRDGKEVGTVSIRGGARAMVLQVELAAGALSPGLHGIHLHEAGDCSDRAKFESAKAHAHKEGESHGFLSDAGPEAGDLPNLYVAPDGSARADFATSLSNIAGENSILDEDGFAVIVHEGEDDYKDKDSAGGRMLCAEIKRQ